MKRRLINISGKAFDVQPEIVNYIDSLKNELAFLRDVIVQAHQANTLFNNDMGMRHAINQLITEQAVIIAEKEFYDD